ncbi:hypothetical protein JXB11_02565 [Candidatus Woesearchaeota archaeon]|nr:hypothetical protein [Candidatus Woesearchaeota archaeon]
MAVLKKVGVLSVAKMAGIISAVLGLIYGLFMAGIGVLLLFTEPILGILWITSIIWAPIGYGIMGFLFGALYAWMYNILAKRIGGIEFEFTK